MVVPCVQLTNSDCEENRETFTTDTDGLLGHIPYCRWARAAEIDHDSDGVPDYLDPDTPPENDNALAT